ncbi:MAG: putative rane protein [Ferruginibacter sp.]|nr:putative rane protein [Ferruginibacter sp.]
MGKLLHSIPVIICLLMCECTTAQVDPHFSQYYAYPLYLNPAFTGVIDGDYRATAIYKNQWISVGKPYSTAGLSIDMTTNADLNLGLNIFSQTAGDGGYHYMNGSFSLSYQGLRLGEEGYKRVLLGLQLGYINRRFDPSKLRFGDQWTANLRVDPNISSSEIFKQTSASSFDAAAGIAYQDESPDKSANIYAGFSINHLTRPEDPFLVAGLKRKLPYRYTYYAGIKIKLSDLASFTPNIIYMRQGNAEERMFGAYFQRATSNEHVEVMTGFSYRYKDAVVPYAGLKYNNLQLGLSYDATTSTLGRSVSFTNSLELSISITGKRDDPESDHGHYSCPPRF